MTLFTIGFTRKSAERFFGLLREHRVDLLADVRLNTSGQLAGFTKKEDLRFFLSLFGIAYEHWTEFAPTREMRQRYHETADWAAYEEAYRRLIRDRRALERDWERLRGRRVVLLCSEERPDRCHRRLAAEMIAGVTGAEIVHL